MYNNVDFVHHHSEAPGTYLIIKQVLGSKFWRSSGSWSQEMLSLSCAASLQESACHIMESPGAPVAGPGSEWSQLASCLPISSLNLVLKAK